VTQWLLPVAGTITAWMWDRYGPDAPIFGQIGWTVVTLMWMVWLVTRPTGRYLQSRRGTMTLILVFVITGSLCTAAFWIAGRSVPADESVLRHQLRLELAELIARGRMLQNNVVTAGNRLLDQTQTAALFDAVAAWHMEVIRFVQARISNADAMRLMAPATTGHYPPGIETPILFDNGRAGVPLMQSWDYLVSDLAALEAFLAARPEP